MQRGGRGTKNGESMRGKWNKRTATLTVRVTHTPHTRRRCGEREGQEKEQKEEEQGEQEREQKDEGAPTPGGAAASPPLRPSESRRPRDTCPSHLSQPGSRHRRSRSRWGRDSHSRSVPEWLGGGLPKGVTNSLWRIAV